MGVWVCFLPGVNFHVLILLYTVETNTTDCKLNKRLCLTFSVKYYPEFYIIYCLPRVREYSLRGLLLNYPDTTWFYQNKVIIYIHYPLQNFLQEFIFCLRFMFLASFNDQHVIYCTYTQLTSRTLQAGEGVTFTASLFY